MTIYNVVAVGLFCACAVMADNTLHLGTPVLDRPTLTALGVQFPITGDDNLNASVSVRYRQSGTQTWKTALPLFRVHPESTANWNVAPQFAGSIFDLRPGTNYDIELHAIDPDGPVDQLLTLSSSTRSVPTDPLTPRVHRVTDNPSLASALQAATPGDIILLADGIYNGGSIFFFGSGTAANPIVIRGTSQNGTIIDGNGCTNCNILEIYGSYVHVENLTLRNGLRALRFQTEGTRGNVVRRLHITNVTLGIGMRLNSLDYYIADNILEGRLKWPFVYSDDTSHASDDGINVMGFGHVVAHNVLSGFGDALKTEQQGARAVDFYGNDVLWTYDNGLELDLSEGNSRAFRNRFTNNYSPLSVQPVLGGPAYIFRNIAVNIKDEQMKFHALGTTPPTETNGVLAYHNTFVSPATDLLMNTPNATHHFRIANNLFVGTAQFSGKVVEWGGPIDDGVFDYNGYFMDGLFVFKFINIGYQVYNGFAAAQAGGLVESHGVLLSQPIFANGLTPPPSYTAQLTPQEVTLASNSNALDRGLVLPNINDGFTGSAPDLGAVETGCPSPIYGPRPIGTDETNEPFGCGSSSNPVPVITVSVTPTSVSLGPNSQQPFTASVTNTTNPGVSWSMSPALGMLSQAGLYTAPGSVSGPTAVTITAKSTADPTKSASATVNITPAVAVSVTPTAVSLSQNGQQQFSATVTNSSNTAVAWSLAPSLGSLTQAGLYTAPGSITTSTTVIITATSAADNTKTATAKITLTPTAAAITIGVTPSSVALNQSAQQQFSATVTNTGNTAVSWSMSPILGSLTPAGLYTAPPSITTPTTVTIIVTSLADSTKTATATVNLTPPAPAVTIGVMPTSATLTQNAQQQFSATVTNTDNTAVSWSMSPILGSLTQAGLYTAPPSITAPTTVTIMATSLADNTKTATAKVNLTPSGAITITVSPSFIILSAGMSQQFVATVSNTNNTAVNWSVSPAIGTLTNNGLYTAPASIPPATAITITATSMADSTKTSSAQVFAVHLR